MPFKTFYIPLSSNVFNLAFSSAIAVESSAEGSVPTSIVEDIATVAAVEHPATEVAVSRLMHLRHGGSNPS